ncbi:hypothetical protein [Geoglobus acetivorans]
MVVENRLEGRFGVKVRDRVKLIANPIERMGCTTSEGALWRV